MIADALLIRIDDRDGERMCWSRPALTTVKRRYAEAVDEKRHAAARLTLIADPPDPGTDAPLHSIARLLSFVGSISKESTSFDVNF